MLILNHEPMWLVDPDHWLKKTPRDFETAVQMRENVCVFIYIYAFIQSDLQCIQAIHFFYQYVCSLGIEPTTCCAANAMLYHWATETLFIHRCL